MKGISEILKQYEQISLRHMDAVSLLNRFDSKYQLPVSQLSTILEAIQTQYYVLQINGEVMQTYQTIYYDTTDDQLYLNHHNGKLNRLKIRKRQYVDSGLGFLELKQKNNKGKTSKLRYKLDEYKPGFSEKEWAFLDENTEMELPLNDKGLPVKCVNTFKRITMVNKDFSERCTIDIALTFYSESRKVTMGNMAVVELKQGELNMKTPLSDELKLNRVPKQGFSKYCMGRVFLEPELKQNLFKPKLLQLKKQYNGNIVASKIEHKQQLIKTI